MVRDLVVNLEVRGEFVCVYTCTGCEELKEFDHLALSVCCNENIYLF